MRMSQCFTTLAGTVLATLLLSPAARAYDTTAPSGQTVAQVRTLLTESGAGTTNPDEMRQKLLDAGRSSEEIDAAIAALTRNAHHAAAAAAEAPRTPEPAAAPAPDGHAKPDSVATHASGKPEPFGFEIFRWSPTTFEPLSYGPVDAEYPLGPGDELVLTLWGDNQLSLTLPVNREGVLTLPDVGQVSVQGLTLEEARARIRGTLAHAYSGLRPAGQHSTTSMSLSLGRLRTIQVFLLGQVVRPGSYTLSSVSRVLNALYAAGGPSRDGSLRDVRIMRGGREAARVDLYDVILGGDASRVARLQNGDVLFVPAARRRAEVRGPVRRPGLYELCEGEQLSALLRIAGGPLPEAERSHAQIDRVTPPAWRDSLPGQGRVAIDVRLQDVLADSTRDVPVDDDDVLTLFSVSARRANVVEIGGRGIARPGRYEFRPGMRAADLIAMAGGLKSDAYTENALLTRTLADSSRVALRFVPSGAVAGTSTDNLILYGQDVITVRSAWDLKDRQSVSVHGNVREPGTYELLDGMTLADLLMKAGGFTDDADPQRAEIARSTAGTARAGTAVLAETLQVALERDLARATAAASLRLQAHDAVFIRRDPGYTEPAYVVVEGEVRFPGAYALMRRDERVADLVRRAGGLTPLGYARGATFTRDGRATLAVDLPRALRRAGDPNNIAVQAGDVLHVPRFTPTVQIEGAVLTPVTALWREGAGVGFYITQASGYRADSDRRNVVVIAPNGRVRRHGQPEPGSRVLVPARTLTEPRDHLKDFATLMSVLASLATTTYIVHQSGK